VTRFALSLLIAACAVLGAGCGDSGTTGPATSVVVTRDFGASVIAEKKGVDTTPGLTALRQLETVHKVTTGYGGRYVKSIDTTAEDSDSSWLFYVDGIEAKVGASSTRLKPGQAVQWDFHAWQNVRTGGAIVGAYPLPLKTRGVRLICAPAKSDACTFARNALTASGIVVSNHGPDRVIVGAWSDIEGFDGVRDLTGPGDSNGAYAQFSKDGGTLTPFSGDGSDGKPLKSKAGLLAPFADPAGVVWLVTGTDEEGARSAAELLHDEKGLLKNHFAMIVGPGGPTELPEGAGQ
jgi:hypothetical protein